MEGLPRMSDQLNSGASSETTQTWKTIRTNHTPINSKRRIWKDDYDGQMIFGNLVDLKLPDICLTGEETPPSPKKNLTQETCPDRRRTRYVIGAHATACSIGVDLYYVH